MSNIYLITSNSYRLMEEEINKIVKSNPYTTLDFNITTIEDIIEEASYFSLFDEKKYLVVKNATIFSSKGTKESSDKTTKKDDLLLNYLNEPNDNTILIFTLYGKADSKKKIVKTIKDNYTLINIEDLKPKEIYNKVDKLMKDKGFKLEYNTIYYIINNCFNNYDLIYNELQKIELYYKKGCTVKHEDVQHIISKNIEDNNFKFIDAVIGKNIKESFKIYDDLMLQKVEPIMLLSMLSKEIRNMVLIKKMMNNHSKKDLMNILNIKFDFQIDKLINNSYSFKEKELENYLLELCDFDYKIKSGKISNKLALEMFILKICN